MRIGAANIAYSNPYKAAGAQLGGFMAAQKAAGDNKTAAQQASGTADAVKKSQAAALGSVDQTGNVSAFCKTCSERTYQDGSDDMGVSFKGGGHIDPNVSASVVASHEQEHVRRSAEEAEETGGQSFSKVRLHMGKCPECGKMYVSGGVTETTQTSKKSQQSDILGLLLDVSI